MRFLRGFAAWVQVRVRALVRGAAPALVPALVPGLPRTLARALALLLLFSASLTHATDHALLIGVADYPNLPRRLWLQGPVNDVALVKTLLLEKGFSANNINTLVSRAGPANEPTRANIVQSFVSMRARVKPGDRVFFYLAGHGSQQPQPKDHPGRPTEADGLDEVFLPADVQKWDGTGAQAFIAQALLDDEIGEWIDSLVDAGAVVWGVFDTCHAAGMARGPGQGNRQTRSRAVSPAELGIAAAANTPTRAPVSQRLASVSTGEGDGMRRVPGTYANGRTDGRSLAFAARGHEPASEEWLPRGTSLRGARMQGVFTWHLVQHLRSDAGSGPASSAALPRAMRATYANEGRASPVPQWVNAGKLGWP